MMKPDIKSILQSIFDDETADQPDCQLCRRQLSAYIDAELDGEDAAALFPVVKQPLRI